MKPTWHFGRGCRYPWTSCMKTISPGFMNTAPSMPAVNNILLIHVQAPNIAVLHLNFWHTHTLVWESIDGFQPQGPLDSQIHQINNGSASQPQWMIKNFVHHWQFGVTWRFCVNSDTFMNSQKLGQARWDRTGMTLIHPAVLYGQETTTPTLYISWKLNDLKVKSPGKFVPMANVRCKRV